MNLNCKFAYGRLFVIVTENKRPNMHSFLQVGEEVFEVDTWGIDCYTAKNIRLVCAWIDG